MKFSKLLLAAVGATVLLSALVSSASARNFSASSQTDTALWRRLDFTSGFFGTIECEVKLSGSLHTRTSTKTVGSLLGYITEGTVLRCSRGGMTINQGSLPWHRRYSSFTGTLPNITGQRVTITGAEWTIREPAFGITCTVGPITTITIIVTRSGTVIVRIDVSGEASCSGNPARLSGSETNVLERVGGARISVTLI